MPYLTPNNESGMISRSLVIPAPLLAALNGALYELCQTYNWEQFGDLTPQETADLAWEMYNTYQIAGDFMIGSIIAYCRDTLPANVLICDGSTYDRVDYPALYDVLPARYIVDEDTFTVPDLSSLFVLGGAVEDIGDTGGEAEVTLSELEIPAHTHSEGIAVATLINGGVEAPANSALPSSSITGSTGGGQPHNNMPPYIIMVYGIIAL